MTVFPARRAVPSARALPPVAVPHPRAEAPGVLAPSRPSPLEWARRLRAEREARRLEAAGARALGRLDAALSVDSPPPREIEELARLKEAHAMLRNRVESAIGEIDSLLERQPEEAA